MGTKQRVRLLVCLFSVGLALGLLGWLGPQEANAIPNIVEPEIDLSIEKTGMPDPVIAGQELLYTITVSNHGTGRALGVSVTDTLPSELEYVADNAGCDTTSLPQLACELGDMSGGESRSFEVMMHVPAGAVQSEPDGTLTIFNTAQVAGSGDYWTVNNIFTEPTFVGELADLRVIKVSKPDTTVRAGETFTYTIFADNLGPSYARNVVLTDTIISSGYLTVVSLVDDPARNDACALAPAPPPQMGIINCQLGEPLEPVGSLDTNGRWRIQIGVRANEAQDVNNVVDVFTAEGGTPDPDTSNNRAMDFISVDAVADLAIVKSDDPDPVYAGQMLTYTMTITNSGPCTAENVVIADNLPSEVWVTSVNRSAMMSLLSAGPIERDVVDEIVFLSGVSMAGAASCSAGTPGDPDDPTACRFGALVPGESAIMTVVVLVRPDVLPEGADSILIQNDAWVYSDDYDPDPSSNYYVQGTEVRPARALLFSKTAQQQIVGPGEYIDYTIVVTNTGSTTALNVQPLDTLTDGGQYLTLVESNVDGGTGSCHYLNLAPPKVKCYLGDLPPSVTRWIDLRFLVDPELICGVSFTNTVGINTVVNPTLSIDPTSDVTETVSLPPCLNVHLPVILKSSTQ